MPRCSVDYALEINNNVRQNIWSSFTLKMQEDGLHTDLRTTGLLINMRVQHILSHVLNIFSNKCI